MLGIVGLGLVAQDRVLVGGEALDQAHPQPVLGHVRAAQQPRLRAAGDRRAAQQDLAAQRLADAGQRVQQLGLAVAGDPGDAQDLARPHREADPLDPRHALVAGDHEVAHLQHRLARPRRPLLDPQQHLAADHQLGQLLLAGLGGLAVRHHRPGAHDADLVGHRHDLAQLVGDQDDGAPLRLEVAQDAEQMVGLLRRQHAGGLVQDQDAGAAEQGLEDLDPLLHAHGQARHRRVEVDLEPIVALECRDLGPRPRGTVGEREAALGTEQQVLQDRERLDQHEMLVDHADARPDRVLRALDGSLLAVDQDGAAVGLVEAVEDVHQGRLAGAVLADDAVDRPRRHDQVDVAVGVDQRRSACRSRAARPPGAAPPAAGHVAGGARPALTARRA